MKIRNTVFGLVTAFGIGAGSGVAYQNQSTYRQFNQQRDHYEKIVDSVENDFNRYAIDVSTVDLPDFRQAHINPDRSVTIAGISGERNIGIPECDGDMSLIWKR